MVRPLNQPTGEPLSRRTAWDLAPSPLIEALAAVRQSGRTVIDLTVSNPTRCGLPIDTESVLAPLRSAASLVYEPDPRGLLVARQAVARYYSDHGASVDPADLLLTAGTSEAYSFLFRLLADVGDNILIAQPGYPLFPFLADLESIELRPYPLFFDFGWTIDRAALLQQITPQTRAVALVHPNNPTGHATMGADRCWLVELCAERGLALIVDEVFLDYPLGSTPLESFAGYPHPGLTFVVSGLSKIAALPQIKVAWIAAFGPEQLRQEANARLEVIADSFLSVSTPAQHALPAWLDRRSDAQGHIRDRLQVNLAQLASHGLAPYPVSAGWSAVLPVARTYAGEDPAVDLLRETGVLTHAGAMYGFASPNTLVLSLLTPPQTFLRGLEKIQCWGESRE